MMHRNAPMHRCSWWCSQVVLRILSSVQVSQPHQLLAPAGLVTLQKQVSTTSTIDRSRFHRPVIKTGDVNISRALGDKNRAKEEDRSFRFFLT
jgi:hypothetical protein